MSNIEQLELDPVVKELMELVGAVRRGEVLSLSVIITDNKGDVYSKKLANLSPAYHRAAG